MVRQYIKPAVAIVALTALAFIVGGWSSGYIKEGASVIESKEEIHDFGTTTKK